MLASRSLNPSLTHSNQMGQDSILVCFAMKQEARPFEKLAVENSRISVLVTGIGARNARSSIQNFLSKERPGLIISAGFAGALRPELSCGTVLFETDGDTGLEASLLKAGARPGRFHCVDHIATTAEEKRALFRSSGADAVEMESAIICAACHSEKI